uniref:hypothetical protein n=1 Tax=Enterocloster clostridioformis TaxID=1531 RepID=UPI00080C6A04
MQEENWLTKLYGTEFPHNSAHYQAVDRLDMALLLAELKVDSIPLNFLIPIPSTPLEHREKLKPDEIVRIVAIFRYINPTAAIRMVAGRSYFENSGEILFRAGANATLTGYMWWE